MDHATSRNDLARAVLEGVAMLAAGLIERVSRLIALGDSISVDGGLSQSPYFMQFLASTNRAVVVPPMHILPRPRATGEPVERGRGRIRIIVAIRSVVGRAFNLRCRAAGRSVMMKERQGA